MEAVDDKLEQKAAIMEYLKITRRDKFKSLLKQGLPATKIDGRWISRKSLIDGWLTERIIGDTKQRVTEGV